MNGPVATGFGLAKPAGSDTLFVGPVLYAGAEVIRLLENPKLQISAPKPSAVNSALHLKAKR